MFFFFFFFNDTATTEIYTLSLHDALPISGLELLQHRDFRGLGCSGKDLRRLHGAHQRAHEDEVELARAPGEGRSEEHTSELQSPCNLVCRLLLEKKKKPMLSHRHIT